ncbi:protein of unknown function [Pseudorhizobium banfieldiae]|uniref:Uncharacterized protein n=1 Tax=Pseudorhizobium banfieldiae TaxID=1125847 RepID=L0NEF3_9HYPH|nr:hypothetical protein [Pseudorhizobium banfieldiae]CAD6606264.1 phage tail collar protein [arsenite-oxidising bacterium NT-25]CCF19171.1 protein of unknown function [Pseudorhizobium banfieldiae]
MANTQHFNIPKPDTSADVDDEFYRLMDALDVVDAILFTLQTALGGKASSTHGHGIPDITGLEQALADKMPKDKPFSLDDLQDVEGAGDAALNYVLVKGVDGRWRPSSAAAAIGNHQHGVGDITGLAAQLSSIVSSLRDGVGSSLDTLKKIAAAINNDPNFAATNTAAMNGKVSKAGDEMTGNLLISKVNPMVRLHHPNVKVGELYVDANGRLIYRDQGGQVHFYIDTGGGIWTQQLGHLSDRIENRALAWANDRVANLAFRKTGHFSVTLGSGTHVYRYSGIVMDGVTTAGGTANPWELSHIHCAYLQAYDPVRGWVAFSG